MPKITYIEHTGKVHEVEVRAGLSVMEGATLNNIEGILAECGGACACATCHVFVDPAWQEKVGAPSDIENDMLDFSEYKQPNSRLSCQIRVEPELDGLVVRLPPSQK